MNTQKELKDLLSYDADSGLFTRKVSRGHSKAGDIAGYLCHGYIQIEIDGKAYGSHRLAWLFMNGEFPKGQIDHINHAKDDNRWINLREATNQENHKNRTMNKNNTSGVCGVYWSKQREKWQASIKVDGKNRHLGFFADKSEAIFTRKSAEAKHGYHANHGVQVA